MNGQILLAAACENESVESGVEPQAVRAVNDERPRAGIANSHADRDDPAIGEGNTEETRDVVRIFDEVRRRGEIGRFRFCRENERREAARAGALARGACEQKSEREEAPGDDRPAAREKRHD